jgi:hypothetical protein
MDKVRYFKEEIESVWGGEGVGYYEYTGEFCTRQIKVFGERIELYKQVRGDINTNMTDQRLTENSFAISDEISQSEFESVWNRDSQSKF